jgi:DNA (cytosine-5)-methyltransferase 1
VSLVLSLFPGIGLLDMAFEEEGFCVVRGPDLLWGGDIRRFHPPAGKFDGVIGGPPCKAFSGLANLAATKGVFFENLIPEYERVVAAAMPAWFVMENVPSAPLPSVPGYIVKDRLLNNRWLGESQNRARRFSFGTKDGRPIHVQFAALEPFEWEHTVTGAHAGAGRPKAKGRIAQYTPTRACELQGLPADWLDAAPFTMQGKLSAVANGVPLPMGRAIARAVKRALA